MGHESQIEPWSPLERRSALLVSELTKLPKNLRDTLLIMLEVAYYVTYPRFALISFGLLHRFHHVTHVTPADDCTTLEYASSAPSADLHNDRF